MSGREPRGASAGWRARRRSCPNQHDSALDVFAPQTPEDVRVPGAEQGAGVQHFCSFAPSLHMINGFVQQMVGLFDLGGVSGDLEARALLRGGGHVAAGTSFRRSTPAHRRCCSFTAAFERGFRPLLPPAVSPRSCARMNRRTRRSPPTATPSCASPSHKLKKHMVSLETNAAAPRHAAATSRCGCRRSVRRRFGVEEYWRGRKVVSSGEPRFHVGVGTATPLAASSTVPREARRLRRPHDKQSKPSRQRRSDTRSIEFFEATKERQAHAR